jgi:hypothetical protein
VEKDSEARTRRAGARLASVREVPVVCSRASSASSVASGTSALLVGARAGSQIESKHDETTKLETLFLNYVDTHTLGCQIIPVPREPLKCQCCQILHTLAPYKSHLRSGIILYGGTKYSTVHTVLYRGKCHSTIKYWMWTAGTAGPGRVCRAVSLRE